MKIKDISRFGKVNIFIDSGSFKDYTIFHKIEGYFGEENINIYELYIERKSNILPTYEIKYPEDHGVVKFIYGPDNKIRSSSHLFYGKENHLGIMSKVIFGKNIPYEFQLTEKLYIAERLGGKDVLSLFITNDKTIIKRKKFISERLKNINICTLEIAEEILGLYLRRNHKFYIEKIPRISYTMNSGLYYLYSFRHYVGNFLMDEMNLDLSNEILFKGQAIIKTLDELGFQYYGETNNDTAFNTKYYFYTFLTLVCGIYDKLAISINEKYDLGTSSMDLTLTNTRKSSQEFRKKLGLKNKDLLDFIVASQPMINIAYKIRNLIVHTEGLSDININNFVTALKIDKDIQISLMSLIKKENLDIFYKNGIIKDLSIGDKYLLVPFLFSKFYSRNFFSFMDKFFKLSGNQSFIDTLDPTGNFFIEFQQFRSCSLKLDI